MLEPIKILLVEDDEGDEAIFRAGIESAGNNAEIVTARTCSDAETLADAFRPEVVVLDLGLPDADEYECIPRLRSRAACPVVVLTSREATAEHIDRVASAGAALYVTKGTVEPRAYAHLARMIRGWSRPPSGPVRYAIAAESMRRTADAAGQLATSLEIDGSLWKK